MSGASIRRIVGKLHIVEINLHNDTSLSSISPSTSIIEPKIEETQRFLSFDISFRTAIASMSSIPFALSIFELVIPNSFITKRLRTYSLGSDLPSTPCIDTAT